MDTSAFIEYLKAQETYEDQIVHVEHLPPREAVCAELDEPLHERLQTCIRRRGITSFYTHQAEAVNAARQGKNVMVATSSASGKSLCYNIAVI